MTVVIKTAQEVKEALCKRERPIGFVPTMGALHAGHVSLIKAARDECKTTIVSIFVNPLQFGPNEDYSKYPRDLLHDLKICEENNVDFIFVPEEKEIYPDSESKQKIILPPYQLSSILCGKTRPTHFQGVTTVMQNFFNIIESDYAYFGTKDLQQLYIVRWLVKEFNFHIFVRAVPIVREPNGLACSSRNRYLSSEEKDIASNIYQSLQLAKQNTRSGFFTVSKTTLESIVFLSRFPGIKVEYFEAKDKENLAKVDDYKTSGFYFLTAVKIGNVRLIDNIEI